MDFPISVSEPPIAVNSCVVFHHVPKAVFVTGSWMGYFQHFHYFKHSSSSSSDVTLKMVPGYTCRTHAQHGVDGSEGSREGQIQTTSRGCPLSTPTSNRSIFPRVSNEVCQHPTKVPFLQGRYVISMSLISISLTIVKLGIFHIFRAFQVSFLVKTIYS